MCVCGVWPCLYEGAMVGTCRTEDKLLELSILSTRGPHGIIQVLRFGGGCLCSLSHLPTHPLMQTF